MSAQYRVEVIADHTGVWCGNGLSFSTLDEAESYARDLFSRWTAVRFWRVIDGHKPLNEDMTAYVIVASNHPAFLATCKEEQ